MCHLGGTQSISQFLSTSFLLTSLLIYHSSANQFNGPRSKFFNNVTVFRTNSNDNSNSKQVSTSILVDDESRIEKRQILPSPAQSPKFISTNELDVFLDDMNHNELRSVANGHPIDDFFRHAKPPSTNRGEAHQQTAASVDRLSGHSMNLKPAQAATIETSETRKQIYSDCALILQRTFVKNIDDPKHQLVPFGKTEQACISYKHIDKAIEQAKHNLKFRDLNKKRKKAALAAQKPIPPPFEIVHSTLEPPEDLVAAIGEINMATTQIIADQFDLSNDELLNGLPLIDMSKTKFWPICPLLVKGSEIKCELSRFRTHTGHCNNLKHPTWGAAMTPFARYLPPVHPDGIWVPRKSIVTEMTFDLSGIPPPVGLHSQPRPIFDSSRVRFPDEMQLHHQHGSPSDSLTAASSIQFTQRTNPSAEVNRPVKLSDEPMISAPVLLNGERMVESSIERARVAPSSVSFQSNQAPEMEGTQIKPQTMPTATTINKRELRHKPMPADLPSARLVTSIVHKDIDLPSHDFSILFMSWGQMLDHDMTRAAQPPSSIKCCGGDDGQPKNKHCLPIKVPPNDPLYSKFNVACLEFRRSLAGVRPNCVLGPRVHQNAITAPIDANFVYGSSQAHANDLRLFKGGRLRDRDWFRREGLKPLLPAQDVEPDLECIARPRDLFCFLAGDVRANEQTHLTVLHTLYMREHNRMADKLAELNSHWNDERVYQETRHIMAAGVQHVMINEYLPLLIGKKMSELYNLTAHGHDSMGGHHQHPGSKKHYWHGYDPTVTTSVSNSFAAAAFRFGHTFVQGTVERFNKFHEFVASERLRHLFKQPFLMYKPGVIDELVSGMVNQASQSYDPFVSEDISGHLFQPPDQQIGHDLPAINLQRGREQGLPGYNLFREWCGLPRAETFDQLEPYLTNHTAFHYSKLYKHVDDIDLWSGGVSERKLPGAAIGPTFACIIARQFSNTRRGDRFWYENPHLPSSFTPEQLGEIRKITLAKILCANADDLPTIQQWALRMAHPVLNPRVACDQIPEPDLRYWQEE